MGDHASAQGTGTEISFGASTHAGTPGYYPDDVPFSASGSPVQVFSNGNLILRGQLIGITEAF